MKPEDIKNESHVLYQPEGHPAVATTLVGRRAGDPSVACIRASNGDILCVPIQFLRLDPSHHYDKKYAPDGYGLLCACGHSYGRHFDGYENDPLYPDLSYHAGCKYCTCGLWHEPTPENQLNRLHDRRSYKIRITRDVEASLFFARDVKNHVEAHSKPYSLAANTIIENATLIHSDGTFVWIRGEINNEVVEPNELPADAIEVLERKWEDKPDESTFELEQYQPEHLRLKLESQPATVKHPAVL